MADFSNIYNYQTNAGIVIPQYSDVADKVVEVFREVFGNSIDTTEQTATGRLIEAVATMLRTVLQVNAQNANNFNPRVAVGEYLDNIAGLFGIPSRGTGESDTVFRSRVIESQSRGSGFTESIRNALAQVTSGSIVVLENGYSVPTAVGGIVLDPHSIFVCVSGGTDAEVAEAIYSAKSAGCGYTTTLSDADAPTVTTQTVTDATSGTETAVYFFRPVSKTVDFTYTISGPRYTGSDIVGDTETLVNEALAESTSASTLTSADIISYVASSGIGIVLKSLTFGVGTSTGLYEVDHKAYETLVAGTHTATVA